jgi:hypothetical protein
MERTKGKQEWKEGITKWHGMKRNVTAVSKAISVQNIQSVRIFQYTMFSL